MFRSPLSTNLPSVVTAIIAVTYSTLGLTQAGYAAEKAIPAATATDLRNTSPQFWWPERLDLAPLRQHAVESSPLDKNFDYSTEFKKLDLKAVKKDIEKLMKTSQEW